MSEILPSYNMFITYWQEQYKKFRLTWEQFNNGNNYFVPSGRWETAIAIMPNNKEAKRYKYLPGVIDEGIRDFATFGRRFGKYSFREYCHKFNIPVKERYDTSDVLQIYDELCQVEFPETSISNPTKSSKHDSNSKIVFEEYTLADNKCAKGLILEHIIFPFDFVATYEIPLFQPQATIYFLTRIREPYKYSTCLNCEALTMNEKVLLDGTKNSNGINSFLREFLSDSSFREWERVVNSELSVLRLRAFLVDFRHLLAKNPQDWTNALELSLPTLIRGDISKDIPNEYDGIVPLDFSNIIEGALFYIDTRSGWNRIDEERTDLIKKYKILVSEIVVLMKDVASYEVVNKQARMYEKLKGPLYKLTEALEQTYAETQQLRTIIFPPSRGLFAVQKSLSRLFDAKEIENPNKTRVKICHQPYGYRGRITDAQWVFAHAISILLGRKLNNGNDVEEILKEQISYLVNCSRDPKNILSSYSQTIISLLNENDNTILKHYKIERYCIEYLDTIKEIFFTTLKPECALKPIKLYILKAMLPDLVLKQVLFNEIELEENKKISVPILAHKANPFANHGELLEIICSFIDDNTSEEIHVDILSSGNGSSNDRNPDRIKVVFRLASRKPWIHKDKLSEIVDKVNKFLEIYESKGKVPAGKYGNFTRPFVMLLELSDEKLPNIKSCGEKLSFLWDNMQIHFNGCELSLCSERG